MAGETASWVSSLRLACPLCCGHACFGHGNVFCRWVWDRWVMMGGIGFTVGLIGFMLYTLIGIFGAIKYNTVRYKSCSLAIKYDTVRYNKCSLI